ncbi:MAG: S8 family serine peptidase, partial [Clostridiales bacterium]|nr:S8 family serine peptidase [Clostridiales bacterium]
TITLPATAVRAVAVGACNAQLGSSIAPFSGRGFAYRAGHVKPDIVAPGVDVWAPRPGGGYGTFTGTSIAAPLAAGAAALLMEWGIVRGNDPYLFGEKIKAALRKGAARPSGMDFPNAAWGYGSLCVLGALESLREMV